MQRWKDWRLAAIVVTGWLWLAAAAPVAAFQEETPAAPSDGILPIDRAWEYQHYRVRVWLCDDGSPIAQGVAKRLPAELTQRAEVLDGCGWEVLVNPAPAQWNARCLSGVSATDEIKEVLSDPQLRFDDKLVLVCLTETGLGLKAHIREFDLTTRQWSALLRRDLDVLPHAATEVFDAIRIVFMPLARIDRVTESNHCTLRARAINSCWMTRLDDAGEWVSEPNKASPAWVRNDDKLLPVLRRTDRRDVVDSLEAVPFTFITINLEKPPGMMELDGETSEETQQQEESYVQEMAGSMATFYGTIHQSRRAVLMGRTSKRLQKLALVIRPPSGTTQLNLVSNDRFRQPMEGVDVYSRPLFADPESPSEYLGKTDWRGVIDIPPSDDGLRLVLLMRGARGLRRLPLMPGLYSELTAEVDNDEAALYAQGVVRGLESEIVALLAERKYLEELITNALEAVRIDDAQRWLSRYESLPTVQKLNARMADDQERLRVQAKNQREVDFILALFGMIRKPMEQYLGETRELEFRQKLQAVRAGGQPPPQ